MTRLIFGILSAFCAVAFAADVNAVVSNATSSTGIGNVHVNSSFIGKATGNYTQHALMKILGNWTSENSSRNSTANETIPEPVKLTNKSMPAHIKDVDYPDSSDDEYIMQNLTTNSKENISSTKYTSKDNRKVSNTQSSSNVTVPITTTENINVNNNNLPEGNDTKASNTSTRNFFSTPTTLDVTNSGALEMQSTNSTPKIFNTSTSAEPSPATSISPTNSSEKVTHTVTPDSYINASVSTKNVTITQNNSEITSAITSSSIDISTRSPIVVSVTNTEVASSDETRTKISSQSTYTESSTESKSSSTHSVIKTTKSGETTITATKEEKTDSVTESVSAVTERARNRTIKLVVSVVFLTIATISMAVLITYMIRVKRSTIQYDELTLLP